MAQVNGRARPEADGSTLAQLLERDGFDAARVACELNGAIVPRDAYAATVLRAASEKRRARGWWRRAWALRGWAAWGRTSP